MSSTTAESTSAGYEFEKLVDIAVEHERLELDDGKPLFTKFRDEAEKTFQLRDIDAWLIQQLEDNAVEVGEMDTQPSLPVLPSLSAVDDALQIRRAQEVGRKIEEARQTVNRYRHERDDAGAELAFRLREEEVAARDRVTVKHQAMEAGLIERLQRHEGILQKVPNMPFTWTVEWCMAPQEFTVNVTSLRGLRNKVRDGYYVFLLSVYDHVGGRCYRFSTGENHLNCSAALPPQRYGAKSSQVDLFINQTVSLTCPSPLLLNTHAVLCVELWQLRVGKYDPMDKVVGFGYFPLVEHNYRVVEGRFKMPLLTGKANDGVDTFRQMGSLIERGLQYWLGNLYFEVKQTRRLQKVTAQEALGANGIGGQDGSSAAAVANATGTSSIFGFNDLDDISAHTLRQDKTADDVRHLTYPQLPPRLFFDDVKVESEAMGLPQTMEEKQAFQLREVSADADSGDLKNMNQAIWSKRARLEEEKRALTKESHKRIRHALSVNSAEDDMIHDLKIRQDIAAHGGTKSLVTADPLHEMEVREKVRDSHVLLENHHHALVSQREFIFMGRNFMDKQRITKAIVLDDIGYNAQGTWDKTKLVTTLLFAVLGLYVRLLLHGVGKYLYLGGIDVPIIQENWYPWHIDLRFEHTSRFYPFNSVLAAIVPNLCVILMFVLLGVLFYALVLIFDYLPHWATRLVFWLGVGALLDAPLTVIAESAAGNFDSGECFLLYNQFLREEKSGIHGALLIFVFYTVIAIPQAYFLYLYATYVHLNGRAVDIYERITYPENSFFVPHDIELSALELNEIVKRAKNYRSERGDIKRVVVKEFNYKFTCLFRDRLFKLLSVLSNEPEEWITRYVSTISIRRPRHATRLIKSDGLGSFVLGNDIMLFMRRHFPTMCSFGDGRLGDREEDHYYEQDTIVGIASHSTAAEDEKEMRSFLRQYFLAQVSDPKPVEWDNGNPLSFVVKNSQMLADLIFFETDGSLSRLLNLRKYLADYATSIHACAMDDPTSWREVQLPNYDRHEPLVSTQGDDAQGVIMFISVENPATGTLQLLRSLVVTPFGQILEPKPTSYTFKAKHTADDPEFWAAKSIAEAKQTARRAEYGLKLH